jgi:hypothetical protein
MVGPGHFNFGMNNVHFEMPDFNSSDVTKACVRDYFQAECVRVIHRITSTRVTGAASRTETVG